MADKGGSELKGFFASCWEFRNKLVWSWDFLAFLIIVVVSLVLPGDELIRAWTPTLGTAAIALGAALVGVVVAGFAVVVALLDDELLALMESDTKSGRVAGHLFPYWFVAGSGVATFLLGLLMNLTADLAPAWATRILFAVVAGLLVWTALGVFNLVTALQLLGINRAVLARGRRQ